MLKKIVFQIQNKVSFHKNFSSFMIKHNKITRFES
jgi:hypothetical protein